jgi:hypothetical protein
VKSVFSAIEIGVLFMLALLMYPHGLCLGKTGTNAKHIGGLDHTLSSPQTENCAHRVGNFWMSVTNWGNYGYWFGNPQIPQPDCPRGGIRSSTHNSSAEFPGGSGINYLYQGGIWIGAIVDDDTLVSVGIDGWQFVFEMYPQAAPYGGLNYRSTVLSDPNYDSSAVSEFDILSEYTDTLTDPGWVTLDPYDARPHSPLGIKIVQESYSWSESTYEDFIIFSYRIKNTGNHHLKKAFFGLYFDCDVWHFANTYGFQDDISGSYRCFDPTTSESVFVAWSADNDGDPTMAGEWDERSPRGAIGVTLLDFPIEPQQSFNWWFSWGDDPNFDWGPRPQENNRDFGTGGLGTPEGDRNKYYVMSTPERDYDQLWEAVDLSSQGWLPPLVRIGYGEEGSDTRFLLSFGSIDLAPGDSMEFAFAVVMGNNFHRNPTDFQRLFDPNNPQAYHNNLDFSDLTTNVLAARQLYRQLFVVPGDFDRSGEVSIADAVGLLNYLFLGGSAPRPLSVADSNGDCRVNFADVVYLFRYLFRAGPTPISVCAQ